PQAEEKQRWPARKDAVEAAPAGLRATPSAVPINQRQVWHSMNDYVGCCKSIIRIVSNDTNIPADRRSRHNYVFARIAISFNKPAAERLGGVDSQQQPVDGRGYAINQ